MRNGRLLALLFVVGCGPEREPSQQVDADTGGTSCTGVECQVVDCAKMGKPPTSMSGTAYAPNGKLALYGATIYVPHVDPGPFKDGVECSRCVDELPGGAVAYTQSDTAGKFTLSNVPSGTDIPLFITIGKWRRKVTIPMVAACQDNVLPASLTSLPKNRSEGDLPRIAIATGSCDALECLLHKLGVGESEFTSSMDNGRIHLYASNGADQLQNSSKPILPAATLWGDVDRMKQYDVMLFSCECGPEPAQKPQPYMNNLKAYADMGGRVFLSHYHSIWIEGEKGNPSHAPAVWPDVATCDIDNYDTGTGVIDQVSNPKGTAFAQWMIAVQASTTLGQVAINESRQSCSTVDPNKTERWVYMNIDGTDYPQNFQFTTPQEVAKEERCGKVVFSDMHVASGSTSTAGVPFPTACATGELSPQEKALAFMLFDISTCVGPIL